jgi:cobalt transporter subunit CbtA
MNVLRNILFSACLAGLVAGVAVTGAQLVGTVPLILASEAYERPRAEAPTPHDHGAGSLAVEGAATHDGGAAGHDHGAAREDGAWAPADGLERTAFTAAANILTTIGFALLLAAGYVIVGRPVTWREGLLWGLGGFVAFTLAPGLGLPPELPGMPTSEVGPRQLWWIGTVVATGGGLALLFLQRSLWGAIAALALIAAPHLVGAPAPPDSAGAVPHSLWRQFVVAATLTSLLSWALLGGLTGALHQRFMRG